MSETVFGPVYLKTMRDSRLVVGGIGLVLGILVIVTAWAIADQFDTIAERRALRQQMALMPALFQGLIGKPIDIETLPGFVSWRLVGFMPLMLGLWSVVALAGTLAGEAARGTLEVVLSAPISRRSLAVQKYVAHATGLLATTVLVVLIAWLGSLVFAELPGDVIGIGAGLAEFGLVALIALFAGSIAFALAPLVGRGVAAGVAATYLFAAYVVNGYSELVPGFDILRALSIFHWTEGHRPLAGVSDWPVVMLVLAGAVALAVVGALLFERRDLASVVSVGGSWRRRLRTPGLGRLSVGHWSLVGVFGRSVAERLPAALIWGGAMGLYGLFIAAAADSFAATINSVPQIAQMVRQFYPDYDFSTVGGILQLAVFAFLTLVAGLASAALVAGWTSDERNGRLEVVLVAPIRRSAWALRSGAGVLLAVVVMGVVVGLGPALGAAAQGDPWASLIGGGLALAFYGAALIGVGFVIAGFGWPGLAGPAVAGLTLGFYLLDLIGAILRLPDWVLNLSLNRHLGRPMSGSYDVAGVAFCLVVAVGGLLLAAWAYRRRDLQGI